MKRFVEGADRTQITLLPECIDDYIAEDNPVRVIEAFMDEIDLQKLGFAGIEPQATGRPANRCPAGQRLINRFTTVENGMTLHVY
jgi:transposase